MKKIITLSALTLLSCNNSFGMLRGVKAVRAPQITFGQRYLHTPDMVRIVDFESAEFINNVKEANEAAAKIVARNEKLMTLLKAQTSLTRKITEQHNKTLDILNKNTNKDYVEVPDVRPHYNLLEYLEGEITGKE